MPANWKTQSHSEYRVLARSVATAADVRPSRAARSGRRSTRDPPSPQSPGDQTPRTSLDLAHSRPSSTAARRTSRWSSPITSEGTGRSAQNITVSSSIALQVAPDALCSAPRATGKAESDW